MNTKSEKHAIAVIGMACWYPGAHNLREFWENILSRRRQFRRIPDCRLPISQYYHPDRNTPDKTYGYRAALLDGFEFDWASRRIPLVTYKSTDIAHWLALETALAAIEDAGYAKGTLPNERTGVIVGNTLTGEQTRSNTMRLRWPFVQRALETTCYSLGLSSEFIGRLAVNMEEHYKSVFAPVNEDTLAGGLSNTIAGRICHYLDLHGGGYTIDGACSSSVLAVATAASNLASGDLDMAIAGGVDISLDPFELVGFAKTGALTMKDMTVYDRRGSGFIPGEGTGFAVLKRLEDARRDQDYVYAVIHGWGISSDGGGRGITAPNPDGQARALLRAYERTPYRINSVDFIEGHGTGTTVGDRVELEAVAKAMGEYDPHQRRSCGMTSLKSIIGHTKAASGIGGFIKVVMAVNRRVLPPTAACKEPHQVFSTTARHLFPILQGEIRDPSDNIKAGVSGMGFGGINCHISLTSGDEPNHKHAPLISERALLVSNQETEVFCLSSNTFVELEKKIQQLIGIVEGISLAELCDLASAMSLETDPKSPIRAAVVASTPEDLNRKFEKVLDMIKANPVQEDRCINDASGTILISHQFSRTHAGFVFPGQGSQKINMARRLWQQFDCVWDMVQEADQIFEAEAGLPLSHIISHVPERASYAGEAEIMFRTLSQTQHAQPAICLASAIWHRFLTELGIKPVAVTGHSLGELTAFYASGAYDFSELMRLAVVRGNAMSAPPDEAGTMASLRCQKEEAERIVAEVTEMGEYIVLANVNGPRQMVLSGSKSGIAQAVKIAERQNLKTHQLSVSNAFHSNMASKAAEVLREIDFLPPTPRRLETCIFTSMNGAEIQPSVRLASHFSRQVVSQVDFISTIANMSQMCDIFIEVGPGSILTGLVNMINESGPPCFSVESLPMSDKSLNQTMAALFVYGFDVNWRAFYANRLIRPFQAPSEKSFIVNPCERPFAADSSTVASALPMDSAVTEGSLAALIGFPGEQIHEYLKARGPFLADVIRADLKHPASMDRLPSQVIESPKPFTGAEALQEIPRASEVAPADHVHDGLLRLVHETAGFPVETISLNMRLLDDLNLDSIKAGELVAKFAQQCGFSGEIESEIIANATLQELIDLVAADQGRSETHPAPQKGDAQQLLLDILVATSGFPADSMTMDMRLLDDLNLDSIKAGEVLAQFAQKANVQVEGIDLQKLANAPLSEILTVVSAGSVGKTAEHVMRSGAHLKVPDSSPVETDMRFQDSWVREFRVELLPVPDISRGETSRNGQENVMSPPNALIIGDSESKELIRVLKRKFEDEDGKTCIASWREAADRELPSDPCFTHHIAILPPGRLDNQQDSLRRVIDNLCLIASPPREFDRHTFLTCIQFGGGSFGTEAPFADIPQTCAAALAKSIHLERSDLRVRVLDFSAELSVEDIAEKIFAEMQTSDPIAVVGYDDKLTRQKLVLAALQPAEYAARHIEWSPDDVFLVTGGAKGITALCTLALAQETGVRMALIGRTPYSQDASAPQSEIAEILDQYRQKGLQAKYYACDVSDYDALYETILNIRQDLGQIKGVIHGAGLNVPRLIQDSNTDGVLRETSPKILGALNIARILDDAPPALFVGLTSIIGVTGMAGNAWYGFSNEILDLILRRFQAAHPETQTQSIAYSVWRDEGMGKRMGSVESLKQKGIDAIPTAEGVNRFVRLCLHDPGVHQVVVAARLRGLDIWETEAMPQARPFRYLEKPFLTVPGVESVFTCRLSLEQDPYVKDHDYNGSYLFPTVFGLEAMAQVVSHATGFEFTEPFCIKNIQLQRPIVVDPKTGTEILVRALVLEKNDSGDALTVQAWVSKADKDFRTDYFRAVFILKSITLEEYNVHIPETPLPVDPRQFYRPNLLFQGPLFHRIAKIWSYTPQQETAKDALLETTRKNNNIAAQSSFPAHPHHDLCLGDAFFRDSLLHAAQLLVPRESCLPVQIKSFDITPLHKGEEQKLLVLATLDRLEGREIDITIIATDQYGHIIEKITGYQLKILKHLADNPAASELVRPQKPEESFLKPSVIQAYRSVAEHYPGYEDFHEHRHFDVVACPNGPDAFVMRIPISFRPNAQLSRTVYFSNYVFWVGEIREVSLWPVLDKLAAQFATGKWGAVTNYSKLKVLGEATAGDMIEMRVRTTKNYGSTNSTMDLTIDFRKMLPSGLYERLAICEQGVTFVRILEHGIVKPEEYPDYYRDLMQTRIPDKEFQVIEPIPEPLIHLFDDEKESLLYQSPPGPVVKPLLVEHKIMTSLDHANLVGNIYFANYCLWQGTTRDRYFHALIPEYYKSTGENGELLCLTSTVHHLREAMPFDDIVVSMALRSLSECRVTLYFEYFRKEPDDSRVKLAYGEHLACWVVRDNDRKPRAAKFPDKVLSAFDQAIKSSNA